MKKYLLAISLLTATTAATAQMTHEFSLYATGGLSGFKYSMNNATVKTGMGAGGGVGYTLFFSPQWGLATGLDVQLLNTKLTATNITDSQQAVYDYGGPMETMSFLSTYAGYEEAQRANYLQIPLMLHFQTATLHKYYAAAGVKAGFALSGAYKMSAAQLKTSGYFPETGQTFTDMPNHGFATLANPSMEGNLDFGMNMSLAIETGMRWQLSNALALYTGLYLDCGVLNIAPEKTDRPLVNYRPISPTAHGYSSVLTAKHLQANAPFTDKITSLAMGVKIKIAFDSSKQTTVSSGEKVKVKEEWQY